MKNITKAELIKKVDHLQDEARRLKRTIHHMNLDLTVLQYVDKSIQAIRFSSLYLFIYLF